MDIDVVPAHSPAASVNGLTNGDTEHTWTDSFDFSNTDQATYRCKWSDCKHTSTAPAGINVSSALVFTRHMETHLPETDPSRLKHNVLPGKGTSTTGEITRIQMLEDEDGDAAGVPLRAALVLRNMARFMPKTVAPVGNRALKAGQKKPVDLMSAVFSGEVLDRLSYAMSHGHGIKDYCGAIFKAVKASKANVA